MVHVASGDATSSGDGQTLASLRELSDDLGGRWHELQDDDPARALAAFAAEHQITQIVIGSSQRSRWQEVIGGRSIVRRIIRQAGAVGIDVHVIARRELPKAESDVHSEDE